ncbi:hypothetical protein LCGC14_0460770 [marine sediment metagenome]|uniref:Uncharacterized protein n=1 Tax=marine sediment metagenome TaxID=412755 RepID=A0A0F9SF34_9ZZZZ|nr:hypothetical protein [bacterium]
MFKLMWIAQRRKLVPIIPAFLRAAYAEIMWRIQLRTTMRKMRRDLKIWDKIEIPVEAKGTGAAVVKLSIRRK